MSHSNKQVLYVDAFSSPNALTNTAGMIAAYSDLADLDTFDYRYCAKKLGAGTMNGELVRLSTSRHFDLVHFAKCESITNRTVDAFKRRGARTIHFYGDYRPNPPKHALALGAAVDTLYLQCDDEAYFDKFRAAGATDVRCCLSGVDVQVFKRLDVPKLYDVSFFGNKQTLLAGHRFRNKLLEGLEKRGIPVHVFGNKWANSHPFLTGHELARALNQSRIVLAMGGVEHVNMCTSWPRILTAMASGTFVLCRNFKGLDSTFIDGKDLVKFYGIDDCENAIKYYLANEKKRERIARNGRITVLSGHRWTDRVQMFLNG